MTEKKRVLSCIQPTSNMHLGNYFGAVKNWVDLQEEYECVYGIVDLHAMTMPFKPANLQKYRNQMVFDLLACGVDPKKATLFLQSLVPEHTELCWILSCFCSYGDLTRMAAFKEKKDIIDEQKADLHKENVSENVSEKGEKVVTAGLFNYPVLQAADILIYRAHYVPVGEDQKQHLELSNRIARSFNRKLHEHNKKAEDYFIPPEILLTKTPKIKSLADPNKKMSKSLGEKHFVGLFEEEKSVRKKVKSAVTDPGNLPPDVYMSPGVENLFIILRACGKTGQADDLQKQYDDGKRKYIDLKDAVADALVELTTNFRNRRAELLEDKRAVKKQVKEMSAKAREIAQKTLQDVRSLVGLA